MNLQILDWLWMRIFQIRLVEEVEENMSVSHITKGGEKAIQSSHDKRLWTRVMSVRLAKLQKGSCLKKHQWQWNPRVVKKDGNEVEEIEDEELVMGETRQASGNENAPIVDFKVCLDSRETISQTIGNVNVGCHPIYVGKFTLQVYYAYAMRMSHLLMIRG
ncbi:hypothetical protein Cgig2_024507 [Carnegiea gigantea]|uniref:Uncharacterized protein n=1 Tax=Carnegiea gigantea TaxID=171969 RepID=A0A9Q1KJ17_9CARY|nr:hypothetical protein Cgig2_024507 [Carnegiea gigantea]